MSQFLQALERISYICRKADVIGTPRISITFDNDADTTRFAAELNRDINNIIAFKHHKIGEYSEFTIYGINVRLL